MNRMLRSISLALFSLGVAAAALSSCARQNEGQRCDPANGLSGSDSDCADNLVCTNPATLQHAPQSDVCCPADGSSTTLTCTPKQTTTTTGTGGSGGAGGSAGTGGDGGAGGSGAAGASSSASSSQSSSAASQSASSGAGGSGGNGGAGGA